MNANASWNETAIQAAAQTGQVEIAEFLLAAGAPLDICTAAMLNRPDEVESMLQGLPELINARGAHGIPLLYFPLIRGHSYLADYLLMHGADVNANSPGGITPLHGAVMFNQTAMATWLLEHGAAPNPRYDGKTPLAMALANGKKELAEVLRKYGGVE